MPKETMTPKERMLAVLKRQKVDRVPMNYSATAEAHEKLKKYMGCDDNALLDKLHIDRIAGVGPKYTGPPVPEGMDTFGCRHKNISYGTGVYNECIFNPLAQYQTLDEMKKNYKWPSPDWYDYSEIPGQIKGMDDYPIQGGGSEPFLIYKNLRGQEQAFLDLILNPDIVHYCLDQLFGLAYQNTLRIFEAIPGKVMISYVAEDLGGQQDLMYSPQHIREFMLPWMKKMMDLVHQAGAFVFHHTDGAARKIIPDLIEAGIDVLNPVQWRCKGMEREGLKKDFGDKLIFHGGVDNQYTLAFGSVEEVRQEVIDNIRILGKGGGYILAPCHAIQAVSPPENVIAMYETGYENG
ncbi:uroporphyrinogen-III decarboxylase-like protein [Candidatus Desantisbacteria bacterium CG_4_10_14_0_8_um_filter_48_22]|uniref:Uroporphyrinogen-III decarboxylase-like protein n=1 Tax=Candidatus Desantisbacteria bacterium CG_4_10_14_0_8_um_filter_48_22 TaxID=1974543 RepID=A0A2M7S6K6_9BACT|nr:MAG: uroporphyrinogen-III decarboxylase-like protein [Candidatus Desantisbacteria bacterium CG02_land_8_20_14_3_00_49_13]PIZ15136.1 MAG: uroporphyrinogen-III decarboxylase-like protein [Candidatus Desantisbacteria bacterium CG_4_10_14_0_8_um_filter_48_22]